jgi:hypothetical protein
MMAGEDQGQQLPFKYKVITTSTTTPTPAPSVPPPINYTVTQEAPPPAATQADIASDAAKSFGSGVVRGTAGLADLP